ncbi:MULTISPECIES: DUF5701 family protein [unclassified Gordonia (in: high G+C Gram-positive bacteria)]|uniref:DUF5701 family protein n=1 Tax=unclassified Gordonia (in: high G+C Gram-positive bacteria) TaxID=2657482 RepID=UPI001F0DDA9D|nr:DUF5701 family protein [Gordonia sp. ABSL49_1]MCH5643564.1 DUF5701 family protein [Gordonia sp. ABSL49_1]
MTIATTTLPDLQTQFRRLADLGVPGMPAELTLAGPTPPGSLLALSPDVVPASVLSGFLRRADKPGFVVEDMTDVDLFAPVAPVELPDTALYLVTDLDRGDHLRNASPNEAIVEFERVGRTPLTLSEGICWLLQQPELLEPNHCFMTIGSRRVKPNGKLDARTPGIWISGGTGRDGTQRRDAPKVGWCWAGNRHTWLGFASGTARLAVG